MNPIQKISQQELRDIITKKEPFGLFIFEDKNCFVACDNTSGEAFVEEFETEDEATEWLNAKYADEPLPGELKIPVFPNGFTSWQETHFEIAGAIAIHFNDESSPVVTARHEGQGHGGLYELAKELTDKFEKIHAKTEWGINTEFFDEIEAFIKDELTDDWTCTDIDTLQYGRKISDTKFEFKELGKEQKVIDIEKYTDKQIEEIICSYGYTLQSDHRTSDSKNIHNLYSNDANWIIAECIYESEN